MNNQKFLNCNYNFYACNINFYIIYLFRTDKTVLASTGCWCDVLSFVNLLQTRIKLYSYEHRGTLSTSAIAQLVSNSLYYKRFFPYYISNMVVGLDENGAGVVYGYDPVGHFTITKYLAAGSSTALIQPFLDNQVGKKNQENPSKDEISIDTAMRMVKDCFISASERDIYCGDSAHIVTITKDGFKEELFPLRKD